jgi:hypothetical protein
MHGIRTSPKVITNHTSCIPALASTWPRRRAFIHRIVSRALALNLGVCASVQQLYTRRTLLIGCISVRLFVTLVALRFGTLFAHMGVTLSNMACKVAVYPSKSLQHMHM